MNNDHRHFEMDAPCNEDIEQMSPTERGAYCKVCQREVHDFTNATTSEIKAVYEKHGGDVCGTFRDDQVRLTGLQRRKVRRMARFAVAAIVVFGMQLFSFSSSIEAHEVQTAIFEYVAPTQKLPVHHIEGVAIDQVTAQPLPYQGLTFYLDDEKVAEVETDEKGHFKLELENNDESAMLRVRPKGKKYHENEWLYNAYKVGALLPSETWTLDFPKEVKPYSYRRLNFKRGRAHFVGKFQPMP